MRFPKLVRQILEQLQIELVPIDRPKAFGQLWFASTLGYGLVPTQLAVALLRESLLTPSSEIGGGPDRLYISRRRSQRQFFDESRLEAILRVNGFELVAFEDMTFREQATASAKAIAMVGPHGAGLTNQVFMPEGAEILEIASTAYLNPVFQTLATNRFQFQRITVDEHFDDPKQFIEAVMAASQGK